MGGPSEKVDIDFFVSIDCSSEPLVGLLGVSVSEPVCTKLEERGNLLRT